MRKVREVLRLRFELGCSQRQIQASTGLSKGSVCDYLKRATAAGLAWDAASSLTDAEVEGRLFRAVGRGESSDRAPVARPSRHLSPAAPGNDQQSHQQAGNLLTC